MGSAHSSEDNKTQPLDVMHMREEGSTCSVRATCNILHPRYIKKAGCGKIKD